RTTMSQRARALILAAMVAALNLAAMTTVAQAQTNDQPTRPPPAQGQVGKSWHQPQPTAEQPTIASDARRPPTQSQVGEPWHHQTDVPAQPAAPCGPSGWIAGARGV